MGRVKTKQIKDKGEPARWITVKGKHLPVYPDGSIGVGQEKEPEPPAPSTDYRISHRPGNPLEYPDEVATVDKITSGNFFPKDILEHPDWYLPDFGDFGISEAKQLLALLKKAQKNPDMEVTVYRGAPSNDLNQGDWVTLSKEYAKEYAVGGRHFDNPNARVSSFKVKIKELSFDGDSFYEFGYWGKNKRGK